MNSPITFPPPEPTLKLIRPSAEKWAATLAEERRRLQEDHDALREREQNLRAYEARLRSLQAEIEATRQVTSPAPVASSRHSSPTAQRPSSRTPFTDDPVLQSGWEKLHRAREIFEAEQKNLVDDRIALREFDELLKQREEAVVAREQKVAERQAALASVTAHPAASEPGQCTVSKITCVPFNMARSVFGGKK